MFIVFVLVDAGLNTTRYYPADFDLSTNKTGTTQHPKTKGIA